MSAINFDGVMELTTVEGDEEDFELPAYGTEGWVLVQILGPGETSVYRYDIEEWATSDDASPYWIEETEGMDFWMDQTAPEGLSPGWYVFEGVVGEYHRGDGYTTDDDVSWTYKTIRPATQDEIQSLSVTS